MSVKREELRLHHHYSLGDVDNVFEVIGLYKGYHWIAWLDNDDVESVYFESVDLKQINPHTITA